MARVPALAGPRQQLAAGADLHRQRADDGVTAASFLEPLPRLLALIDELAENVGGASRDRRRRGDRRIHGHGDDLRKRPRSCEKRGAVAAFLGGYVGQPAEANDGRVAEALSRLSSQPDLCLRSEEHELVVGKTQTEPVADYC